MNRSFLKMTGTGNDFLVFDDREEKLSGVRSERWADLCARRTGVGADGILLLRRSARCDVRMVYLNADGREAAMCGNGSRCLAWAAAVEFGLGRPLDRDVPTPAGWEFPAGIGARQIWSMRLEAADGEHHALGWGSEVLISIGDPAPLRPLHLETGHGPVDGTLVTVGVPHFVAPVPDPAAVDLAVLGPAVRHHPALAPAGANATFVAVAPGDEGGYLYRTWERGVEAETLSCGTGAAAAAVVLAASGRPSPIALTPAGGPLTVYFRSTGPGPRDLWLQGPVRLVYRGIVSGARPLYFRSRP